MATTIPKKKYYYHITPFQSYFSIKNTGIKCSEDGYIYMLDTDEVVAYVAVNQLLFLNYGLFRIDSEGINVELEKDLVGELTVDHQFRIRQDVIDKKYIKDLGMKKIIDPANTPYEIK